MHAFRDREGREWIIRIHVAAIRSCRALADVDILKLVDNKFKGLAELLSDPVKLVDVIYVLCKEEADHREISDEMFGRAMAGDCIQQATDAFIAELIDFFPDARVRTGMKQVVEKGTEMATLMMDLVEQDLAAIDLNTEVQKLRTQSGI